MGQAGLVSGLKSSVVTFVAPRRVEVQHEELSGPGPGRVLVQTRVSAISAGTELLVYRGQAPSEMAADESIAALEGSLTFPLRFGYSAVGDVIETGKGADGHLRGRRVFAFNPHASLFEVEPEALMDIPKGVSYEDAAMLPSMETAVNFAMDGAPLVGENVLVIGQGVIGLLTTSLLTQMPLGALVTLDTLNHVVRHHGGLGRRRRWTPQRPALRTRSHPLLGGMGRILSMNCPADRRRWTLRLRPRATAGASSSDRGMARSARRLTWGAVSIAAVFV